MSALSSDQQAVAASASSVQVAIMFLVKSVIPTESIWTAFIASAAEMTLRQPVPHTRPPPPTLLPEIVHSEADMSAECWKHGGPMTNFGVPPRQEFQGAASTAALHQQPVTPLDAAISFMSTFAHIHVP